MSKHIKIKKTLLSIISLFLVFNSVNSVLFFNLVSGSPKCFIDELYTNSVMMIKWKVSGLDHLEQTKINNVLQNIHINFQSEASGQTIKKEVVKESKGKISFHSQEDGQYRICIHFTGGWGDKTVPTMSLQITSDNMDEPDIKKALKLEDLDKVSEKAKKIINDGKIIINIQSNELMAEEQSAVGFMKFSSYFFYITVFQVVIILILGLYQAFNFRKFLASNNVI